MDKQKKLLTQCCICYRFKVEDKWETTTPEQRVPVQHASHGYCPSCFIQLKRTAETAATEVAT